MKHEGRWGYIDPEGRYAINPQYDEAGDFEGGLAPVRLKDAWGYINEEGKYIWTPTN